MKVTISRRRTLGRMDFWLTMEIQDGAFSAQSWRRSHSESLVEAAVTNGVQDWTWRQLIWGVVLELQFADESARARFKDLPAVTAALDAVPDPVFGLLIYRGLGGGAGAGKPRQPRPSPIVGSAEMDEAHDAFLDLSVVADSRVSR